MAKLMKVTRVGREYIKPSIATPSHLKNFKLSLLDQLAPSIYAPMVFFYPMQGTTTPSTIPYGPSKTGSGPTQSTTNLNFNPSNRVKHLKESLSPFLTRFYPFAGRIKDHVSVACNDAGVEFLEAKVNTTLGDFLKHPNATSLKNFLPIDIESRSKHLGTDQLVHVQTNTFECGGMALGVCWSHKITDGGTVSTFMKGWSSMASGSKDDEVIPKYVASSLFPPSDSLRTQHELKLELDRTTTKRFVFDGAKIAKLKARVASEDVPKPTRVEAVSSLLWKCATKASRTNSRSQQLSVMSQSMNIRRRTSPTLPNTSIGNLVGYYTSQIQQSNNNNHHITLKDLVQKQRQAKTNTIKNYTNKLQFNDAPSLIRALFEEARTLLKRQDVDFFKCLSTCGDGLYEVDFGWGKPLWVSLVSLGYKNTFALSEARKGGGIEAWVTLKEDDMAIFERDLELLAFASVNPRIMDLDHEGQLLKKVEYSGLFDETGNYPPLLTW